MALKDAEGEERKNLKSRGVGVGGGGGGGRGDSTARGSDPAKDRGGHGVHRQNNGDLAIAQQLVSFAIAVRRRVTNWDDVRSTAVARNNWSKRSLTFPTEPA